MVILIVSHPVMSEPATKIKKKKGNTMASIEVKGIITRIFYEGKGLEVSETFNTKSGESITKRYTVWLNQPTLLTEGSPVSVKGLYSAEIDNWTNKDGESKQSIKVSINNPQVIPTEVSGIVRDIMQPTHQEPLPF